MHKQREIQTDRQLHLCDRQTKKEMYRQTERHRHKDTCVIHRHTDIQGAAKKWTPKVFLCFLSNR